MTSLHFTEPSALPGLEIGRRLGEGGFAQVFVARRLEDGRDVAVKIATRKHDARFEREVAAMRQVGPEIAPEVIASDVTEDGRPYIVMGLVHGVPLSQWLSKEPREPLERRLRLIAAVARVMDAMHTRGICHRDIKPANIVIRSGLDGADPSACIVDFGLARALDATETPTVFDAELTAEGARVGTVSHMAPEQCEGRIADARADIYSVGVILFEVLVGRPPFEGDRTSILAAHSSRRAPVPSRIAGTAPAWDAIVARCLEKRPEDRYQRAGEIADAIESVLDLVPVSKSTFAVPSPPSSVTNRVPMVLVAFRTSLTEQELLDAIAERDVQLVRRLEDGCILTWPSQAAPSATVFAAMRAVARVMDRIQHVTLHVAVVAKRETKRGIMFLSKDLDDVDTWAVRREDGCLTLTPAALAALGAAESLPLAPRSQRVFTHVSAVARSDSGEGIAISADRMPEPPFVDRDGPLDSVVDEARRVIELAIPALITVVGDHGLGKTRFLEEASVRIADTFRLSWKFSGSTYDETRTDVLSSQLVRHVLGLSKNSTLEQIRDACTARFQDAAIASLWPVVAHALGTLGDDAPELAPMRNTPGALRRALARILGRGLLAVAQEHPLCIVVDDVHLADPATLDALEIATISDGCGALLILVAAMPSLVHQRSQWGERAARSVRCELGPLSPEAADRVVRALFVPVDLLPAPVVARLCAMAGGIPLHLVEVAQTLWVTGKVRKRRETSGHYLAADELLDVSATPLAERLARRTLAELPPSLGDILRMACIVGSDVDRRDIDAMQTALETKDALDPGVGLMRLAERGILVAVTKDHHRFKHATTRDALEALMDPDTRRKYHEAALRYLGERQDERAQLLPRIARHAAASGAFAQAAAAYVDLAEHATSKHLSLDAEAFATQALRYMDEDDVMRRERALTLRSEARSYLGQYDDALFDNEAALALAAHRGDVSRQADLLVRQSEIHDFRNDRVASALAIDRTQALVNENSDEGLEARLAVARGRTLWRMARYHDSIPLLERGVEIAATLGDWHTQCIGLLMLPMALVAVDELDKAEQCLTRIIALCEQAGERFYLAVALNNRIVLWAKRQDYISAMPDQHAVNAIARELGNLRLEAEANGNLGELHYYCGDYHEALVVIRHACLVFRRLFQNIVPEAATILARSEAIVGNHEIAKNVMEESLKMLGSNVTPFVKTMFDFVDMLMTDPSTDDLDAWQRLIDRIETIAQTDEDIDAMYHAAERAMRVGHPERAAIFIARAQPKIRGDVWRKRFAALATS